MPFETAPRRRPLRAAAAWFLGVGLVAALSAGLVAPLGLGAVQTVSTVTDAWGALPTDVDEPLLPGASIMLTADGKFMARFAEYDRIAVSSEAIAPAVKEALVATEDVRFYEHRGVDLVGLARALRSNASSDATQGGSTITQQYVKNIALLQAQLSGDPEQAKAATERTLARKISEARKAVALEERYSKDEILTKYLNLVNFGAGAYGIQAAARRYFSTTADKLDDVQAATLVGILNAPSALNPIVNPDGALKRRNLVLARMAANGSVPAGQLASLQAQPLELSVTSPNRGCKAAKPEWGHYCDAVVRQLLADEQLGATQAERDAVWERGGLTIRTAMQEDVQKAAVKAVKSQVPADHRATAVAVVVQPGTGQVAALAMSRDFGTGVGSTELPLATKAVIGPGSTMKMFTLAEAASSGMNFNTRLPGGTSYTSPSLQNPASGAFHNYDNSYASNVSVLDATKRSLNTAMIQIEEKVGVLPLARLARDMGATALPLEGQNAIGAKEGSLTLGAREIPVAQMANAYATVAAQGKACPLTLVTSVLGPDKQELLPEAACRQVLSPAAARAVTYALQGVVTSGTGRSAALAGGRSVAGKTGTNQDVSSAWFAGFTPQWASVVAVADFRGPNKYPLINTLGHSKVYGGTIPAAVFKQTMDAIHEGLPVLPMVDKLDDEYLLAQPASDQVRVPQLTGLDAASARAALQVAGLTASGEATGVIIASVPKAGQEVAAGSDVELLAR